MRGLLLHRYKEQLYLELVLMSANTSMISGQRVVRLSCIIHIEMLYTLVVVIKLKSSRAHIVIGGNANNHMGAAYV